MERIKKVIRIFLIIICLAQTSIVSYSFFTNFGNTPFWSIFYGVIGITFDVVSVYLLALDRRKSSKIVAYCLVFLSIIIFGVEAYSQAPDIKVVNTELVDSSKKVNEKLDKAIDVIIENMDRNESGYGTALTKMTESLTTVIETKQGLTKEVIEEEKNLDSDKRLDVFVLVGERFNFNPKSLLIWFLFIRGLLLETALVVLSNHSNKKVPSIDKKSNTTSYHIDSEKYPKLEYFLNNPEKFEKLFPNFDALKNRKLKNEKENKSNSHVKEKAEEFFNEETEY